MNSDRWQKLKSILAEALEQESPSARSAVIGRSCADDVDLLHEIESLMAEADETDPFEECAESLEIAIPREDLSEIGRRVGAYVIVREIGRGGMGTVYLAARADGYFEKQVAIKVLNRGAATEDVVRRFRAEREVLARLDHPNIARLMDAGTMDDGRPYFVMEHIDGITITRFVEEKAIELTERLDLFLKVSAAVEAAHRNSVIHRDLKPNNILVNREGEPKLLDFGIAKVIGGRTNPLEITSFRQQRLTPTSASPEQVKGEPITVFSDIYALGAVLYEMVTGVRPHRFQTSHPNDEELVEVVCNQLPSLPSLAVKDRARQRQLRGDLDAILVRALQKEPSLRYSSVAEFAHDIRCHLARKPVHARGNRAGYRVKTALFHDRRVQIASVVAVLCLIGLGLGAVFRSHLSNVPFFGTGSGAAAGDKTSIAVLPFDSLTADEENSYFADGVQDAILTNLANVSALKVISRGSVAGYRGKEKNEREIGRTLGVSYVLEGSVQKAGDRVRVHAQLIDTRTLTEVWAQQYDRKVDDLFVVESDLAQAIASQLRGQLTAGEKAAIENRPTKDMLAYDLYLRARESFYQSNNQNALRLLEQAIARDSQFAAAYCLSAEVQLCMYRYSEDMSPERLAKAKEAAETALRIAPKLPRSHLAKAQYYYYGLHDYEQTLGELNAATSSSADKGEFANLAALTERRVGRWKDAIRDGETAVELDPQNPFAINELVESYLAVRRFNDAERLADKGIKSAITQTGYLWRLKSEALVGLGKLAEARAVLEKSPPGMGILYQHIWAAVLMRDFARASQLLSNAPMADRESYTQPFFDGMAARAEGDAVRAQSSFQLARARMMKKLAEHPDDAELVSNLSVADAGLGHKEEALRGARRAIELCPMSRDVVEAPNYLAMLAAVYAWTGEHDAALTELEKVVRLPRGPSSSDLRFSPFWDELRTNARFEALLTKAALPPVYN